MRITDEWESDSRLELTNMSSCIVSFWQVEKQNVYLHNDFSVITVPKTDFVHKCLFIRFDYKANIADICRRDFMNDLQNDL